MNIYNNVIYFIVEFYVSTSWGNINIKCWNSKNTNGKCNLNKK